MEESGSPATDDHNKHLGPVTIHVDYAKSIVGILKVVAIALSLLAFLCVTAGDWRLCQSFGPPRFFQFVTMSAFWATIFLYFIYLVGLDKVIRFINWQLTELIWCAVDGVLFLLSSAILAANTCYSGSMAAGAAFGFFVMVAFGLNGFLVFREFKERVVLSDSSNAASPAAPEYSPEGKY
ncbi:CKLF-like MARVEL transmembrane domain-containing protein 4 [Liolophura sinensis]|uniref:CKLF-like MARVEL transmembrane domain-containing protein 4 n=1 Tax=Liolophura sinensis TaxID=3198878 RepID=UPI0031582E41